MVIKVYISSCSGNIEIKRKQDFVITVLNSKKIEYQEVDIADSSHEDDKLFMRQHAKPSGNDKVPLPPQIFSDERYCGNFDGFHEANEDDAIHVFLGLSKSAGDIGDQSKPGREESYIGGEHTHPPGDDDTLHGHNGSTSHGYDDDVAPHNDDVDDNNRYDYKNDDDDEYMHRRKEVAQEAEGDE